MLDADAIDKLVAAAQKARQRAYAPYSDFTVGAAALSADGRVFGGCNIENASYGATICAERVALGAAYAAGCREIVALALTGPGERPISPCGICRQVMAELAPDAVVIMQGEGEERHTSSVTDLLPAAFGPDTLTQSSDG